MQLKASTAWSGGIRDGRGTVTTERNGLRAAGAVCAIPGRLFAR